ncbi:MAG: hypothetical protein WC758_04555 [Candidatus Woesearchaeota archaeon]|jgi:hypothetical protein
MGDLSNKSLSIFLLASIVVSLGGVLMILSNVSMSPTGYATTATGTVNLSVATSKSITTADSNIINFGMCNVTPGIVDYINSERLLNTTSKCTMAAAANISVRNDGNSNGAVTATFNGCAPGFGNSSCTFLTSSGSLKSTFAYKTTSAGIGSYTGGCTGAVTSYTAINSTGASYTICTTLATHPTANSAIMNVQIGLAPDVAVQSNTAVSVSYTIA